MTEGGDVGARRVDALDRLIELTRVAEQDEAPRRLADGEGAGEDHLSRLVDDQHVDRIGHLLARPQPRGAAGQVGPAGGERLRHLLVRAGRDDARVRAAVAVVRLLDAAHGDRRRRAAPPAPGSADGVRSAVGRRAHGGEKVGDHLVAVGGHPDPHPRREQIEDHPRAGERLAAARRSLHRQHRAVEPRGDAPDRVQRRFSFRGQARSVRARRRPEARRRAPQQVERGAPRAVGGETAGRGLLRQPADALLQAPGC